MTSRNAGCVVTTKHLVLRPLTDSDADSLARTVYGEIQVSKFLPASQDDPLERSEKSILRYRSYWDNTGYGPWAVTLKADGDFIGRGGLKPFPETGDVELIYALAVSSWGKGLAKEIARASLRFAFERIGATRVVAYTEIDNHRSQHVLYAVGFQFLEMATTEYYGDPHACFSLSREKWTPTEEPYEIYPETPV